MYVNIVYSNKISYHKVKKRSIEFFQGTEYNFRNSVFTHSELDSNFSLCKNAIHINVQNNQNAEILINSFLKKVFGHIKFGVHVCNGNHSTVLKSLNYVLI